MKNGILIAGLTVNRKRNVGHKKLFNISTGPGIVEMPGLWKTLRVFHNPLEKLKNSFSTFPQYFFLFLPLVFLFTERLVFLFTAVCVKLLTEKVVFLLDFYSLDILNFLARNDCLEPCRIGGGCSGHPCKIMNCAEQRKLEGCWQCEEMESCEKFDIVEPRCGDTPKSNLRNIKKFGYDGWIKERGPYYIWQRKES